MGALGVIDIDPAVSSPRPCKQKKVKHRRGQQTWSMDMDMELLKGYMTAQIYGPTAYGDKGTKKATLELIFSTQATSGARGMKMKALQTRMTLIMEETSRFVKRGAGLTGGRERW